jgi:hypothetical protein
VRPRVAATAGAGPRYVLLHKARARPQALFPIVLDLDKALYVEPEDDFQPSHLPDARVVGLADDDILFEGPNGEPLRAPMKRFKLYRLLPFS